MRSMLVALATVVVLIRPAATGAEVPAPAPRIPVAVRMAVHYVPPEISRAMDRSNIEAVAVAAWRTFPHQVVDGYPLPVLMTAIAFGESDCQAWHDGDRGTSWGAWQIHDVHAAWLARATDSTDPAVWRAWLADPEHNARAALAVYQGDGLAAWTAYRTGRYKLFMGDAERAMEAVHPG